MSKRKMVTIALAICLLVVGAVVGVVAAIQQNVGFNTELTFRASDVSAKIYYDFYHQSGETKTSLDASFGSGIETGTDDGGKYFMISPSQNGDMDVTIEDTSLEKVASTLPNGTNVATSYLALELNIVNRGSKDIGVTLDKNSNDSVDNVAFAYITNIGSGRTSKSDTNFTILNANYGEDPGVATGTALSSASVALYAYVDDPSFNVNLQDITFPLSFYATDFVAGSSNTTSLILQADSDTVLDGDSSVVNLYADDETTPFKTVSLVTGEEITASGTKGLNKNEIETMSNFVKNMGSVNANALPVGFDIFSDYPDDITSITVEVVTVNNTASKGIFVNFDVVSESQNGGYPAIATSGSGAVANMNNGSNSASIRTSTVKKTYTIDNEEDSLFSLSLTIETIEEVTASHTFTYTATDDGRGYSVKKSETHTGTLTLPTYYNNLLVTDIGLVSDYSSGAFQGCSGLTSLAIPNSVTSIGSSAFQGCSGLTSVTMQNSVTSIGIRAFQGCSGLTSVTIPSSMTSIGVGAFIGCSGLTSMAVNSGNTVYKSEGNCIIQKSNNCLILGCKNSVIPNTVTIIGEYAFDACSGLTSLTIPSSVTSIGFGAFEDCSGLTSITIPNSVTSIGSCAFISCTGLESVTIGSGVTSIGNNAFMSCSGLTSITIPSSVTKIGGNAFMDCSNLTSVTFEDAFSYTTTWYYTENYDYTGGTQIDVTVSSFNATNLVTTYCEYKWYKV